MTRSRPRRGWRTFSERLGAAVLALVIASLGHPFVASVLAGSVSVGPAVRTGDTTWRVTVDVEACDGSITLFGLTDADATEIVLVKDIPNGSTTHDVTFAPGPGATRVTFLVRCSSQGASGEPLEGSLWFDLAAPSSAPTPGLANRPPLAVDDTYEIPAGGVLRLDAPGLLRNDSDPDGDPISLQPGRHTTLARNTTVRKDGSVEVMFPARWNGSACLEYTAVDAKGATSNTARVRVTVGTPVAGTKWALNPCDRLDPDRPPPAATRSRGYWYRLWSVRSGYLGFNTQWTIYSNYCRQSTNERGWTSLYTYYGTWTVRFQCWKWYYR